MKKCDTCNHEFDDNETFYSSTCHDCYAKRWDEGFQSTSEHAYEIGFNQLMERLGKEWEESHKKDIIEVFGDWGIGEWKCTKCGQVRISEEDAEKMKVNEALEKLQSACPECSVKGYLKRKAPKKFFS